MIIIKTNLSVKHGVDNNRKRNCDNNPNAGAKQQKAYYVAYQ